MHIHQSSWTALAGALTLATRTTSAAYIATDTYTPSNFFDAFAFFSDADPTNGMVTFADRSTAISKTLIATAPQASNAIYLGLDSTTPSTPKRASIRIHSAKTWDTGLFVVDIAHMPTGCGVWPAFWMLGTGAEWPVNGEIDILEGVNDARNNSMTLHTNSGCKIGEGGEGKGFTGKVKSSDCDVKNPTQDKNAGCGITNPAPTSFGAGFNAAGGAVIATEVTPQAISIWHFPRSAIPSDLSSSSNSSNPNPSKWGPPKARFAASSCNISQHFKKMQMIFDTTLCGDWAGQAWKSSKECSAKAATCEEFVRDNPEALREAYFLVNAVRVFQEGGKKAGKARRGRRGDW